MTLFAQFLRIDAFDCLIVNFADLSGSIPIALAYGTFTRSLLNSVGHVKSVTIFPFNVPCLLAERLFNQVFLEKTDEIILQIPSMAVHSSWAS